MTDRELLELAAKAAGYAQLHFVEMGGGSYSSQVMGADGEWAPFYPIDDDGDALRLAAKLRIDVIHNEPEDNDAWVTAGHMDHVEDVDGEGDRAAATRRAIVLAAAEIGKAMP
jgi:hypothetical protein